MNEESDQNTSYPRRRVFLLALLVVLVPLFWVNARFGPEANVDVIATAAPAWQLATSGNLDMTELEGLSPWFVPDKDGRLVSDRAPGLIASAVPAYAIWPTENFLIWPSTVVALVVTLVAVLLIWYLMQPLVGLSAATVAALVFALGTTTWAISSAQLWPHGLGQLAAVLTLLALSRNRPAMAGAANAFAITVRPVTSIYAAVVGTLQGWRQRDWTVTIKYGALSLVGFGLVIAYNHWLFGTWSLAGGNAGESAGVTGSYVPDADAVGYFQNLWAMTFGWNFGVFSLSPIVLVAAYGTVRYRSTIPAWAMSGAIGGLVYVLVHAALNRASGGGRWFYRYPLEALALASVALVVGAMALYRSGRVGKAIVLTAALISVGIQFFNVFYLSCEIATESVRACSGW